MTDLPATPTPLGDRPAGTTPPSTYGYEDPSSSSQPSTTDVAKDEASAVKDTAVSAGQNVAATAKDEASNVVQETAHQARSLIQTVGSEVRDQAGTQQQRIASAVHSLSKELGGMASASEESGPLTDLAHQASRRGGEIAHWLENREPKDVLEEVKSFGRRRPVAFLGLCLLAGIVVGRVTRSAVAANTSLDSPSGSGDQARALTSSSSYAGTGPDYQPAYQSGTPADYGYTTGTAGGTTAGTAGGAAVTGTPAGGFPDPVTTWTDQPSGQPGTYPGSAAGVGGVDDLGTGAPLTDPLARPEDTR